MDLQRWWLVWNDPVLNGLVQQALASNLELAQAVQRLRQQRLLAGVAEVQFRPTVSASTKTLQDVAATDNYLHVSLDVTWELGLFGAADATRQAGEAGLATAQAQLQGARVSVVSEVVRRYLDMRMAQRQLGVLDQIQTLDEQTQALAVQRRTYRVGVADELLQARMQASQARALQASVQDSMHRSAQALAVLLGRSTPDPAWMTPSASPWPVLTSFTLAELPADLLRTRPDIRVAEASVTSAAAELGMARAALYPRLVLGGSLLYAYNVTHNRRTRTDNLPAFGPQLDIPLFDWSRRRSQADAGEAALQAALLGYRQSVLEGLSEVEGALGTLARQQQRAEALQQASGVARERVTAAQTLQGLGLSSRYDGLAARRMALQAESEQMSAEAACNLAYVALYKALGGAALPAQASDGSVAANPTDMAKEIR